MNALTKFLQSNLKRAMPIMGMAFVTWKNQKLETIADGSKTGDSIMVGGFNPADDFLPLFIPTTEFTTKDRPEKGDLITDWNNKDWLVTSVELGDTVVRVNLENRNKRRGAR